MGWGIRMYSGKFYEWECNKRAQYERALRDYQAYFVEVMSDQRDKAATKAKQKDHFIKSRRL